VRVAAVVFGLLGVANAVLQPGSWLSFNSVFWLVLCLMLFRLSQSGLAGNDQAVSIVKGWSGKVVRYDVIESFEWLHNLESFGAQSKRLWIVLDDGQEVPAPVVVGQTAMFNFLSSDIWLTQDRADALVADLETRRGERRAAAE
jgi:hypothetical protein